MFPNASSLEFTWTGIAVFGLLFAVIMTVMIVLSLLVVLDWIERGLAAKYGPRHQFVLVFLFVLGCLIVVWGGFLTLGVTQIFNPPPEGAVREASAQRSGWILVGLESFLLLAQAGLLYAWIAIGGQSAKEPVSGVVPS